MPRVDCAKQPKINLPNCCLLSFKCGFIFDHSKCVCETEKFHWSNEINVTKQFAGKCVSEMNNQKVIV